VGVQELARHGHRCVPHPRAASLALWPAWPAWAVLAVAHTRFAGEQTELLDLLGVAYSHDISMYDAQQLFRECPRTNGMSLSTATQLFFSFKIPIDDFIGDDGPSSYAALQKLIAASAEPLPDIDPGAASAQATGAARAGPAASPVPPLPVPHMRGNVVPPRRAAGGR